MTVTWPKRASQQSDPLLRRCLTLHALYHVQKPRHLNWRTIGRTGQETRAVLGRYWNDNRLIPIIFLVEHYALSFLAMEKHDCRSFIWFMCRIVNLFCDPVICLLHFLHNTCRMPDLLLSCIVPDVCQPPTCYFVTSSTDTMFVA